MKKLFCLLLLLTSCFSNKSSKPVVLVTIAPYAYFVQKIAGDTVSTEIFVPPGANPHTYEATPKQVERFSEAKIWFRYGDSMEGKILSYLQEKNVAVVNLSDGIELLGCDCHHEGKDLHVWLNPLLALEQSKKIKEALTMQFPEHQQLFEQNFAELSTTLKNLDQEISQELQPFQGIYLLLSHPSLGYFCNRCHLHQLSIEFDGKEPRPQQVAKLIEEMKERNVRVIFTEPQFNNKGATLLGDMRHIPLYSIDPYAADYVASMREITKGIVKYYDRTS